MPRASPLVFAAAIALVASACVKLQRDKFPGSFTVGRLNDRRQDLFERPRGIDTPTTDDARSAEARVPPLPPPPGGVGVAPVASAPSTASVPPWSPPNRDLPRAQAPQAVAAVAPVAPAPRVPPLARDVVFFPHTYDFNRNQRIDDFLSHVAVVEKLDGDGTVHYVDYSGGRVRRGRLNINMPYRWRDPNTLKTLNSYLRRRNKSD